MIEDDESRDLAGLIVPLAGSLQETGDRWLPYRLLDPTGEPVEPVSAYFRDLQAAGRSAATVRSYGMDLLRWFRFLWAIEVEWDRATRVEARDFCRWLLLAGKPSGRTGGTRTSRRPPRLKARPYAASVRAHARRCCAASTTSTSTRAPGRSSTRSRWTGPGALAGRMRITTRWSRYRNERAGLYRPRVPITDPAQRPGRGVQRDLRPAALAPGPGAGGVLRLDRGAGVGAAVGHAGRCRSRAAG